MCEGFPDGSVVKNLPINAEDEGWIPGLGRSPGGRNGNPLQYSCLGNPIDRGAWRAATHGVTKRVRRDWVTNQNKAHHMYVHIHVCVHIYIYTYIYKRMCAHPFVHTCTCIHPEFHFSLCDLSCHNFKTQMKSPVWVLWLSFLCWWCTFFSFLFPLESGYLWYKYASR